MVQRNNQETPIVYSNFGCQMKFDLRNGFPLLTTKRYHGKLY